MQLGTPPTGYHNVTPFLMIVNMDRTLEFLKKAFGATVLEDHRTPDGHGMHAEVRVGDSIIMLSERTKDCPAMNSMLYLYVSDVDATYASAIAAGAKSMAEPKDQFYGDRSGGVTDESGIQWWIATRKETLSAEEIAKRAAEAKPK